jgi:hypothetical protein
MLDHSRVPWGNNTQSDLRSVSHIPTRGWKTNASTYACSLLHTMSNMGGRAEISFEYEVLDD